MTIKKDGGTPPPTFKITKFSTEFVTSNGTNYQKIFLWNAADEIIAGLLFTKGDQKAVKLDSVRGGNKFSVLLRYIDSDFDRVLDFLRTEKELYFEGNGLDENDVVYPGGRFFTHLDDGVIPQ